MKTILYQCITSTEAVRFLFAHLAAARAEFVAFAYLGFDWKVVGLRHSPPGTPDSVDLPIREVARDAIVFDAVRVVMAHNHPSGDPAPSRADIALTRRLACALDALGVTLTEHVILSEHGFTSLRAEGVL